MRVDTMCKGYTRLSLVMYTCYTQSLHFGEMKNMLSLPKNLYKKVYLKSHCTVCFNTIYNTTKNSNLYMSFSQISQNIVSIVSHSLHMLHTNPSILSLNPIIPSRNSQNLLKRGV